MKYTGYELAWCFFIYAFIGWVLEVVFAAFSKKKFANRGFLNGPLCPIYGSGMIFLLVFFSSLLENVFFLFLASMVVTTFLGFFTGLFMEKFFGRKWWDYSGYKYNIRGYICLRVSLLWGLGAVLFMKFLQPFFLYLIKLIPRFVGNTVLIVLAVFLACDLLVTTGALLKIKRQSRRIQEIVDGMNKLSGKMGGAITNLIQKRMVRAYPNLNKDGQLIHTAEKVKPVVFAEGCSFHKLVWLFFIGAFLGDITETIFMLITTGRLMSRSSVLYGPFSIVWGLAIVILTLILDRYKDRDDRYIFVFGTIAGGAYEYVCSVFTELAFGTIFWDYSKIPFNLGGRVNLLFCFFWGIAALIWLKLFYPFLSKLIEKVNVKVGTVLSWVFVVFMVFNMAISGLALARYSSRAAGNPADNAVLHFLDEHYTDERMEKIYPNAKMPAQYK